LRYLADHVFELIQNSLNAGAKNIHLLVEEDESKNLFRILIKDDGYGIKPQFLAHIKDTFFSTRPSGKRRIGLGLSMMSATCQQTGGELTVESKYRHGTTVTATMEHDHIDRPPLGDLADLFTSLMLSSMENKVLWRLEHIYNGKSFTLKNRKTRDELNIFSFGEAGIRPQLYELINQKERNIHK